MTLGTFGSTLSDELNRLANGGTYRTMGNMVDDALAAKQWANRENINPYSTDTVGILNEIAGLGTNRQNWLDFNGVCNYIAGTTGLPAAAALRQVYNTTDLLTSQSAYYVDATAPTNWGSLGYVRLNGITGNYLSTPDAAALDITGDIDIRWYGSLDNWASGSSQTLISKRDGTGNQRGYALSVQAAAFPFATFSTTGSDVITVTSTAALTTPNGTPVWVRVTRVASTGLTKFFTSPDGTTWTQLGADVSGTSGNIFANTARLEIGTRDNATLEYATGNFYRAQILNGIGGTTVLDVNIATDYRSSNQSFFTATTGQTVTVNGVDTIANLGNAGSLLPTTLGSSTAADSNDPKFLDHTGTNYVYLPGVSGNTLQVPDSAALDITGDIDIRVQIAPDDWTPASDVNLLIKSVATGDQRSWQLILRSTGGLQYIWSTLGTSASQTTINSTATLGLADGTSKWVRVTHDVDNGASGNDVKFWSSDNGTTWTQLGTTVTTAGTTSIYASTADVLSGNLVATKFYRAQIYNGIDGTKVLDVDTSVITAGSQTSFTAVTGQTVTINRSTSGRKTVAVTQPTWLFGTDDYMEVNNRYMSSGTYLYLPGVASNYASTPDAAPLDITGDLDLRVKIALDDWTPAASTNLIDKWTSTTNLSYVFLVNTSGNLVFAWTTGGSSATQTTITSSVATGITDGSTKWVRVTLDVDNGASGNDVKFWLSDDGSTWTQLGTTTTTAGTTSIYSGAAPLALGANTNGAGAVARGKFFRAQVRNGIDGTVAFDANFETSITSLLQTSFTESSANAATVTINRSGSAYRSAGITAAGYLYPGATNTFSASATDFLNFGASQDFTILGVWRQWTTPQNFGGVITKRDASGAGWDLANSFTSAAVRAFITDGTNSTSATQTTTFGQLNSLAMKRDISTDRLTVGSASSVDNSVNAISNIMTTMYLGRSIAGGVFLDMELYAAAVFRSALTASQIRQISNYFANREVYL